MKPKTKFLLLAVVTLAVGAAGCASREKRMTNANNTEATAPNDESAQNNGQSQNAQVIPMEASNRVLAAQGEIKATGAGDNATSIDMQVHSLVKPERLSSELNSYVVWEKPSGLEGTVPQNVGTIKLGENESGTFHTTIPGKNFELFVTAEDSPRAATPTSGRVMWANVSRQ